MIMDFKRFIFIFAVIPDIKMRYFFKNKSFKKIYDVFHWPQKIVSSTFSLCHTPSLFLGNIMKIQVLNEMK
jgi:hypothetical protein